MNFSSEMKMSANCLHILVSSRKIVKQIPHRSHEDNTFNNKKKQKQKTKQNKIKTKSQNIPFPSGA